MVKSLAMVPWSDPTQRRGWRVGGDAEWHASFDPGLQFDKLGMGDATVSREMGEVFVEIVECVLGLGK